MTASRPDVLTTFQVDLLRQLDQRLERMNGSAATRERDEWGRIRYLARRCLVECGWGEPADPLSHEIRRSG
jgi:hypothetical protein